ncbi:MAG TPA: hypothetical protein VEW93_04670 [Acidimicrobiales bacterium]|nr:hypothetical protein [Acidimicrobiales bacterium]
MAAPRTDTPLVAPPDGAGPGGPRHGFTVGRVLGVAAMLAVALFWLWIFSGAPAKQNPDRLDDRRWVERAEAACATTMARIDTREAVGRRSRVQRADDIDTSSAELRALLDGLADPPPASAGDREVVERWLADWRDLLGDRDAYAAAIRTDPDARFVTTEKFNDPLDTVVEIFADVNDMPSCGPAGDVG